MYYFYDKVNRGHMVCQCMAVRIFENPLCIAFSLLELTSKFTDSY